MGKHFWRRQLHEESEHKQPGCMWGLANVLDWNSNVRKMIHYSKYEDDNDSYCDWSPKTKLSSQGSYDEVEQLLDEKQNPHVSTKEPSTTKRKSLRARIKALIAEDVSKKSEKKHKKGSSLRRTYSIHHLESLDGSLRKICTDWKNPIIFFPQNIENSVDTTQKPKISNAYGTTKPELKEETDVLEIFKVDKQLFVKHLEEADASMVNLSRAFDWNNKPVLSKSRSFPASGLSQRRKLRPTKLENKQKEVWSVPKQFEDRTESFEDMVEPKVLEGTVREVSEELRVIKRIHRRSSSLSESLDKYSRLFENSYPNDAKLNVSRSLKLSNENGHGPMYFRRIRSLSNVESYCSDLNLGITSEDRGSGLQDSKGEEKLLMLLVNDRENVSLDGRELRKDQKDPIGGMQTVDNEARLRLNEGENVEGMKEDKEKMERSDSCRDENTEIAETIQKDVRDHSCVSDSRKFLEDKESQPSQDLEAGCSQFTKLNSSTESMYQKSLNKDPLQATLKLDTDENSNKSVEFSRYDGRPNKNNFDLNYVRHILDECDISEDATERTWHTSDQPLGPQLFEEAEAQWAHERDELTGWPEFYGCWHHQMLFHLVNEVLVEVYDLSLPYYPKALSSSCHVRPFPVGNHIIEEVNSKIETLVNLEPDEKQSLDGIVSYDLANDSRWMNLQLESECTALEIEDIIFDELLEEIMCS